MRKALIVSLLLCCAIPAYAGRSLTKDSLPAPRIMAPTDDVDLSGKDSLEFRWTSEGAGQRVYDFRLYKGSSTVEPNLISKIELPSGQTSYQVPADQFEIGQTYEFSIRQIGVTKSRSNYTVFKIVKK